jgi:hypothetical protein
MHFVRFALEGPNAKEASGAVAAGGVFSVSDPTPLHSATNPDRWIRRIQFVVFDAIMSVSL